MKKTKIFITVIFIGLFYTINLFAQDYSFIKGSIWDQICAPQTNKITGLDLGLFGVNTKENVGVQFSFILANSDKMVGFQSSIVALANDFSGWQYGIVNKSVKLEGLQTGFFSYSEETNGIQFGAFNYSLKMSGVQIGIVNYVENMEKGLQVGLLNIIKNSDLPFMIIANLKY